ncbi:MAG: hypothetical protein VW124_10685, partial [Paracoccaceae bacterium]
HTAEESPPAPEPTTRTSTSSRVIIFSILKPEVCRSEPAKQVYCKFLDSCTEPLVITLSVCNCAANLPFGSVYFTNQ